MALDRAARNAVQGHSRRRREGLTRPKPMSARLSLRVGVMRSCSYCGPTIRRCASAILARGVRHFAIVSWLGFALSSIRAPIDASGAFLVTIRLGMPHTHPRLGRARPLGKHGELRSRGLQSYLDSKARLSCRTSQILSKVIISH